MPPTVWDHPLYRGASRKPLQTLPKATETPKPTLSQRETYRAMKLEFQANGPPVLGGRRSPTIRYAPPVALPASAKKAEKSTASLRERLQELKDLRIAQVARGEYAAYIPPTTGKSTSVESAAVANASQAMRSNTSLHPSTRRLITERVAAHLKVAA